MAETEKTPAAAVTPAVAPEIVAEIAAEQATVVRKRRAPKWTKPSYWAPPIALLALIIGVVYIITAALGKRSFLMPRPEEVLAVYFSPKAGPDILAALRALPPETVADVRGCASLERVFADTELDSVEHERHRDRARRLSALADILDTLTTEPR